MRVVNGRAAKLSALAGLALLSCVVIVHQYHTSSTNSPIKDYHNSITNADSQDSTQSLRVGTLESSVKGDAASPSVNEISPSPMPSPSYNITSPSPSPSLNQTSPSPIASPVMNGTSPSPNPSVNGTSPSPMPSPSVNGTSPSPSPSINGTSPSPSPSVNGTSPSPSPSVNGTSPLPSPSVNGTSPLPSPSMNGTSPSPSPSVNGTSPSPLPVNGTSPSPLPANGTSPSPSPLASPSPSPAGSPSPGLSPSPTVIPVFSPNSFYVDEISVDGEDGFVWFLSGPLGDATLLIMTPLGTPPLPKGDASPDPSPSSATLTDSKRIIGPRRKLQSVNGGQGERPSIARGHPGIAKLHTLYEPGQIYGTVEECMRAIMTVNASIALGYFEYESSQRMLYVVDTPSSNVPLGMYQGYLSHSDSEVIQTFITRAAFAHNPVLYTSGIRIPLPSPNYSPAPSPTPPGTGFQKRVGLSVVIPVASGSLVLGIILAFSIIYCRHRTRRKRPGYVNINDA